MPIFKNILKILIYSVICDFIIKMIISIIIRHKKCMQYTR